MEIFVASTRLDRFLAAFGDCIKRAIKCGQPAPILLEVERWWESRPSMRFAMCPADREDIEHTPWTRVNGTETTDNSSDYREIIKFDLQTEVIRLDGGWRLVGTVEPSGAGTLNYINAAPGSCPNDFAAYRNGALNCDHCNAIRNRNMTIVVRNDAGDVKSVGTACVRDYLGTNIAGIMQKAAYAMALTQLGEGDEEDGWMGGGRAVRAWGLATVAGAAMAVLRESGWAFLGRGKARERMDGTPATADLVMMDLCPPPRHTPTMVTQEDREMAAVAITDCQPWVDEIQNGNGDTLSDYQHNVAVAIMAGVLEPKRIGLVVAAVCLNHLRRVQAKAKANQPDKKDSKHFGTVGERLTVKLHPCHTYSMPSDFGTRTLVSGWVEGTADRWDWWTNPSSAESVGMVKDGEVIDGVFELAATIKTHDSNPKYGTRTILTRVAQPKKKKGKS